jgi:hypothetical protein
MRADSVRPDPADGRAVKLSRWPVKSLGDCLEHAGRTSLSCQPAPERTQLAVPSAAQRAAERRIRLVGIRAGTRLVAGVCRGSIPTCAESSSTWRQSVVCYILNDERRQREEAVEIARGRRDDDRGEGRGSSTRSFASCGIRDDERGAGSSPRPPSRTGWPLKSKFQTRSTLTFLGCEAVGVSLLFGWLGQTDRLNGRTDHLAEYGFRYLILGG